MLKFLFLPGYRWKELTAQEADFAQFQSKRGIFKRMNSPLTIFGLFIVFVVVMMAVFAPWLSNYSYYDLTHVMGNYYDPISIEHPFGTTKFGWDVLGRIIWGARSSITVGLGSILISLVFGIIIGLFAAYRGGMVDNVLMLIMDILLAFPGLVLALVFVQVLGRSVSNIMLAFGILGIPFYARLIRGSVLEVRQSVYVESAKAAGASNLRIMFRHILPNCMSPIIVSFTFDIGGIILALAGISFLGFGDPDMIEWGNDLAIARLYATSAWWAVVFPGLAILFTVLGFMLVGDGLRDALDPRLKNL